MVLDDRLEQRIAEILRPMMRRWPGLDPDAIRASNRKQAVIPEGATVLDPVGTAPGLVVPPRRGSGPTVVVLPGPPRELQPMWRMALRDGRVQGGDRGARPSIAAGSCGCSGSRSRRSRARCATRGGRGCRSTSSRSRPACGAARSRYRPATSRRPGGLRARSSTSSASATATRCSPRTARRSTSRSPACSRPHDRRGGVVHRRPARGAADGPSGVIGLLRRRGRRLLKRGEGRTGRAWTSLIERFGAVSTEVAEALALGAIERFDADLGMGVTGIAGPDGGTEEKPVGTVCFSVVARGGERLTRSARLPGNRVDVRERSTTVALHLVRRLLLGETDVELPGTARPAPVAEPSAPACSSRWTCRPGARRARAVARGSSARWPGCAWCRGGRCMSTLCFLGWRSDEEVEEIGGACAGAVGGSPRPALSVGERGVAARARDRASLAVGLDDGTGALARMQASLIRGARRRGLVCTGNTPVPRARDRGAGSARRAGAADRTSRSAPG